MSLGTKTTKRWIRALQIAAASILLPVLLNVSHAQAAAGINQEIEFQGRLLNSQGATVPDGYYNMEFKIYENGNGQSVGDTTGTPAGTLLWTEDYLNVNSQGVEVVNGYLSVELGSINPFAGSVNWNQSELWLSMNVGSTATTCSTFSTCSPDGEMVPMQPLTSAVYAMNSNQLNGFTASAFGQLSTNQTWTGKNIFQSATNSTSAFEIQNSTATDNLFNADTTNNRIGIGTLVPGYTLDVQGGNGINSALGYYDNGTQVLSAAGVLTNVTTSGNIINSGTVANAYLTNGGALTINSGTGLSGGGSVALGGTLTLNLANTTVTAGNYGSASSVATFTLNAQGQLTTAATTPIAINANQVTGGTLSPTYGGTGIDGASAANGSLLIGNGSGYTLSTLTAGTNIVVGNSSGAISLSTSPAPNFTSVSLGTTGTSTGKVVFNGANAGSGTLTLQGSAGPNSGNYILSIPAITANANVCTDNSICSGYASSSGSSNYVQIQSSTPGTAQSGNFNVAGTGIANTFNANTSVLSPTLDTPSPETLNIGTANATGIDIGQSIGLSSGANRSIGVATGTGSGYNLSLAAGSAAGTNNNGGNLVLVSGAGTGTGAGGSVLVSPQTNKTTAFEVQNTSGSSVLSVDTINNQIIVASNAADPSGGVDGALYYNTSSNQFRCYQSGAWQSCNGGGAITSIGTYDSQTPQLNGLYFSSGALYAQSASTSVPGMVNTAAQSFAGTKTFTNGIINGGETVDTTLSIGNLATGGNIGTSASTVDIYSSVSIDQTTGGQVITLPNPTSSVAGRIVFVNNVGTTDFYFYNTDVTPGSSREAIWNGTAWALTGGSPNSYSTAYTQAAQTLGAVAADSYLTFTAGSNETWMINYTLQLGNSNNGNYSAYFTAPAGSTCEFSMSDTYYGSDSTSGTQACGIGGESSITVNGSGDLIIINAVITTSTTAGTVTLYWGSGNNRNTDTIDTNSSLVAYRLTGADYAEVYFSKRGPIQPGSVVSLSGSGPSQIQLSNGAYDSNVIGVVSTNPGQVEGQNDGIGAPVMIGLAGRVPVKVNDQNGPILPGDYLVASSTPGVAMRASDPGMSIGQAMTGWSQPGQGEVTLYIKNTYYPGSTNVSVQRSTGSPASISLSGNNATNLFQGGSPNPSDLNSIQIHASSHNSDGTILVPGSSLSSVKGLLITASSLVFSSGIPASILGSPNQNFKLQAPGSGSLLIQAGTTTETLSSNGVSVVNALLKGFLVQSPSGITDLTVDTLNNVVHIGASNPNTNGVVLALNNYNGQSVPPEVNGGMYYDSANAQFMCGEGGYWLPCGMTSAAVSFNLNDEFMSGNSGQLANGSVGIGQLNWENTLIGQPSVLTYRYNVTGGNAPVANANRPGVLDIEVGGQNSPAGATMSLGTGSMLLGTGRLIMRTAVNITGAALNVLVGLDNETSSTATPTTGVYWGESANGIWQYCYVDSLNLAVCANSSVMATPGSWARLEINMVSSSEIDFVINGTNYLVKGISYNASVPVAPAYTLYNTSALTKPEDLYVDYFQLTGLTSAPR